MFELPNDDKGLGPEVARSLEDWDSFRDYHRKYNPIRYWLHHEFESIFIWPITHRVRRVYNWIRYRTTRRMFMVNTGLKPDYYDVSTRMFHANFNLLKDFVEIEKAHMYHILTEHPVAKGKDGGIAYLLWEMGLSKEEGGYKQAENAREIYELYDWWTNERPYREEDATAEWEAYRKVSEEIYGESDGFFMREDLDTSELKFLRKTWLDSSDRIEKNNLAKDEEMLIRLMKVRSALWT